MNGQFEEVVLPSRALKHLIDALQINSYGQTTVPTLRCCKIQSTTSRCGLLGGPLKWSSGAKVWTVLGPNGQDVDAWKVS